MNGPIINDRKSTLRSSTKLTGAINQERFISPIRVPDGSKKLTDVNTLNSLKNTAAESKKSIKRGPALTTPSTERMGSKLLAHIQSEQHTKVSSSQSSATPNILVKRSNPEIETHAVGDIQDNKKAKSAPLEFYRTVPFSKQTLLVLESPDQSKKSVGHSYEKGSTKTSEERLLSATQKPITPSSCPAAYCREALQENEKFSSVVTSPFGKVSFGTAHVNKHTYNFDGEFQVKSDVFVQTKDSDFGNTHVGDSYNEIIAALPIATKGDQQVALDLLSGNTRGYTAREKHAMAKLESIITDAEEARQPGMRKLGHGFIKNISEGTLTFEKVFVSKKDILPLYWPATAKKTCEIKVTASKIRRDHLEKLEKKELKFVGDLLSTISKLSDSSPEHSIARSGTPSEISSATSEKSRSNSMDVETDVK